MKYEIRSSHEQSGLSLEELIPGRLYITETDILVLCISKHSERHPKDNAFVYIGYLKENRTLHHEIRPLPDSSCKDTFYPFHGSVVLYGGHN